MFKNVLGAVLGSKIASSNPAAGSATGAMLASAVPFVLSRMSIPTMIAVGAGGYLLKRHFDKKDEVMTSDAPRAEATPPKKGRTKSAKKAADAGIVNPPPGGVTNGSGKTGGAAIGATA